MRYVSSVHPRDAETKQRFSVCERINVKGYYYFLVDLCLVQRCAARVGKAKKSCKKEWKKWKGIKQEEFVKPDSMWYIPESDSSDSQEEEGTGGLTNCSV